ncbi:hypothetical protein SAMN05444724_3375 [Salinivibrio sp. ES.052]|nr:hypothetical protein SAMN05444724_3375 [Salinivibrio sp. ES.052]
MPAMLGGGHDAAQRGALADRCSLGVLRDGQLAVKRGRGFTVTTSYLFIYLSAQFFPREDLSQLIDGHSVPRQEKTFYKSEA